MLAQHCVGAVHPQIDIQQTFIRHHRVKHESLIQYGQRQLVKSSICYSPTVLENHNSASSLSLLCAWRLEQKTIAFLFILGRKKQTNKQKTVRGAKVYLSKFVFFVISNIAKLKMSS